MFARSLTLQDMCLIGIVRDIDFFVYKKTIPQKHVDFLFSVYSDEVFSKLEVLERSISEDCMLWLLNPHVKKVTVPCDFQSERVVQKLKEIGFGITSLNLSSLWFSDSKVSEDVLNSIVCCMPHVVRLNLSKTSCSDKTLLCIQKSCEELESLFIRHCYKITNRGMENLCRGKLLLKNLYVKGTHVNYSGIITVLDGMPSLEWIDYDELTAVLYQFGNKKQYNLKDLLYNNRNQWDDESTVDAEIIQALVKMCPKLKRLHFKQRVSQNVLNACAYFQNLEALKIKMSHTIGLKISDVLIPILPLSENLKSLILSCVNISLVTLVECFKSLEQLYLKKVSFIPFEKKDIKISKTNLLTIVMKDIDMEGATYEAITSLISLSKNVSKLYLKYISHLPPEVFDIILKSMKNLSVVNFQFTDVDMQYVNPFFEIPSMSTVVVNKDKPYVDFFVESPLMSTVVVNKDKPYVDPFVESPLMSTVVVNKDTSAVELFGKSTSCTLSWRNMCDVNNCYYNKGKRDESDIISDQCDCFDAENDYDWRISYRDCIIDDNDYPSD